MAIHRVLFVKGCPTCGQLPQKLTTPSGLSGWLAIFHCCGLRVCGTGETRDDALDDASKEWNRRVEDA